MKFKKLFILLLVFSLVFVLAACGGEETTTEEPTEEDVEEAVEEAVDEAFGEESSEDVPHFIIGWGKELHTGLMHTAFELPEEFEDNPVHLRPVGDDRLELVDNGEVLAIFDYVRVDSGADAVTMLSQGTMDIAYCSSTAVLAGYDTGADLVILGPVHKGGLAFVAAVDREYDTLDELVEYAEEAEAPIRAGYHSPVSAPRIVLENALKDAGLKVTSDAADVEADVIMTDLKGTQNLMPSLQTGEVDVWAAPVPYPKLAEVEGLGKIIVQLDETEDQKYKDFPCCTMNTTQKFVDENPEIVEAMATVTTDIHNFVSENYDRVPEYLGAWLGLEDEVILDNTTNYSTEITPEYVSGMKTYIEVMNDMNKFENRLKDKSIDEVFDLVYDTSFFENE